MISGIKYIRAITIASILVYVIYFVYNIIGMRIFALYNIINPDIDIKIMIFVLCSLDILTNIMAVILIGVFIYLYMSRNIGYTIYIKYYILWFAMIISKVVYCHI